MWKYKRLLQIYSILIILIFFGTNLSYAKLVWNKETGWIDPDKLTKETIDQQFKYAISLMVNKEYVSAIEIFNNIIKNNPESELAEESKIKIGSSYHMLGDYKKAFKSYENLIEQNPGTRRLKEILEKEFQVAVAQMETDEKGAIKVFEKIIERNPLGFIAADAQIKIADCHYQLRHFEDAEDSYLRVIENYPNSEWVPYAQFRIPYCKMSNIRIQERNYELLTKSRHGFEEYIANNTQGTLVPAAKEIISEIDITMAKRNYMIGEFYLRRKRPDSGAVYYELVIKEYPNSEWAVKAKEKLDMLRNLGAIK